MKQKITAYELNVGEPIPWDAYNESGVLILRHGEIVPSQKSVERMLEAGLYADKEVIKPRHIPVVEENPSALQLIIDARRMLTSLFERSTIQFDDFPARMEKIVQTVHAACEKHPIICMASILLMTETSYTARHPVDCSIMAYLLAREMALDEATQLTIIAASLTMNIGMYEVQEKINNISGPLNDKLAAMIKLHPAQSVARLSKQGISDQNWLALVLQHHENIDGTGYPNGLAGDAILPGAKIIGLTDRFCAMISKRGDRLPLKPNSALRDLYTRHGNKIDHAVAGKMIHLVGVYPPGTLVRLKSGEIGVVSGPGHAPDTPAVHAVIGRSGTALEIAAFRKTHLPDFAIEDVLTLDKLSLPIRMSSIWGKDAKILSA